MLNVEKYRNEIICELDKDPRIGYALVNVARDHGFNSGLNPYNGDEPKEYNKEVLNWLLSEYKEPPILDEVEREYLSAVCRPYKVEHILKAGIINNKVWLSVGVSSITIGIEEIKLPLFEKNTMYKGMEVGKYYTPQELGVRCKNNPKGEISND